MADPTDPLPPGAYPPQYYMASSSAAPDIPANPFPVPAWWVSDLQEWVPAEDLPSEMAEQQPPAAAPQSAHQSVQPAQPVQQTQSVQPAQQVQSAQVPPPPNVDAAQHGHGVNSDASSAPSAAAQQAAQAVQQAAQALQAAQAQAQAVQQQALAAQQPVQAAHPHAPAAQPPVQNVPPPAAPQDGSMAILAEALNALKEQNQFLFAHLQALPQQVAPAAPREISPASIGIPQYRGNSDPDATEVDPQQHAFFFEWFEPALAALRGSSCPEGRKASVLFSAVQGPARTALLQQHPQLDASVLSVDEFRELMQAIVPFSSHFCTPPTS